MATFCDVVQSNLIRSLFIAIHTQTKSDIAEYIQYIYEVFTMTLLEMFSAAKSLLGTINLQQVKKSICQFYVAHAFYGLYEFSDSF